MVEKSNHKLEELRYKRDQARLGGGLKKQEAIRKRVAVRQETESGCYSMRIHLLKSIHLSPTELLTTTCFFTKL